MKKFIVLIATFFIVISVYAQIPQAFNYQGVAKTNAGVLVAGKTISVKISILTGSVSGSPDYIETHLVPTNSTGLFTLQIGKGTIAQGSFNLINWTSLKFIKSEIDINGGSNFIAVATTQLLSVPYALYASTTAAVFTQTQSQIDAIVNKLLGMQVFNSTNNRLQIWNGTEWRILDTFVQVAPVPGVCTTDSDCAATGGRCIGGECVVITIPTLGPVTASVTGTTVVLNGVGISTGGENPSSGGFVYSTSVNPTVAAAGVQIAPAILTTGYNFTATVSNLLLNTIYYVKGFGTNSKGTGYGAQNTFIIGCLTNAQCAAGFVCLNGVCTLP